MKRKIRLVTNVRDLATGQLHYKGERLGFEYNKAQLWVETLRVAEYVDDDLVVVAEEIEQEVKEDE